MKKTQRILIYLVILVLSLHCLMAQRREIKAGNKLEAQGDYEMASEKYMEALYKNMYKEEALEGLERTAQKVLDDLLGEYFRHHAMAAYEEAIAAYEKADLYQRKINYFNIELRVPDYYAGYYAEDRQKYLQSLYEQGKTALVEGDTEKANELFSEVKEIDPGYGEIETLSSSSEARALYEVALEAYRQGELTKAYKLAGEAQKADPGLDDAAHLRRLIVEKHTVTVAIIPAETRADGLEARLKANVTAAIHKLDNPLIKLIDRENLGLLIEEQKLVFKGILDEQTAAEVGKIIGAKKVIVTRLLHYQFEEGTPASVEKTAYSSQLVTVTDPNSGVTGTSSQYFPVQYRETLFANKLDISFQYQLIDTETAEILASDVIHEQAKDEVHYAEYPGDPNALFPGSGNKVFTSGATREAFLELFHSKRTAAGEGALAIEAQKAVAEKVATSLNQYLNSGSK